MNKTFKVAVAAILLTATGGVASAATTPFDFNFGVKASQSDSTSHSQLGSSITLDGADLSVTAAAGSFTDIAFSSNTINKATFASDPRIGQYVGGLGVVNSSGDGSHTVDGLGFDDFVQLSFSEDVNLNSLRFNFFQQRRTDEQFRIIFDTSGDGSIGVGDFISQSLTAANPFNFTTQFVGSVFGIVALGDSDDWKLAGVSGTFAPAPVPLPAAGLLLLAGLGGLGAMSRRKRKAA
jgi:hypothetical protein